MYSQVVGIVIVAVVIVVSLCSKMEKTKKGRRGGANTGAGTVSTPALQPPLPVSTVANTTTVGDALQDLVFQLSNPSASSGSLLTQSSSSCPSDVEMLGEGGVTEYQQQNAIQTSLDQLGNDISVIKTQLEKKKAKMTLVEVSDKVFDFAPSQRWLVTTLTKNCYTIDGEKSS